jgi:tetratricopeptide (TPR) repeat protein
VDSASKKKVLTIAVAGHVAEGMVGGKLLSIQMTFDFACFRCFRGTLLLMAAFFLLAGCERMMTPRTVQIAKDADAKAAEGDYLKAINLYEAALDDSPRCADIHYKLALLYDDKMNEPLNALHHYKRYLTLNSSGSHAVEVKNFMKRDEMTLATTLSGDAIVTRAEAARLKNENLTLRRQLDERTAKLKAATDNKTEVRKASAADATKKSGNHSRPKR